jgi:hypothetical protein
MDGIEDMKLALGKRMTEEIEASHPYEASQIAISFIARKRKILGHNGCSLLVFHGCSILISKGASADAGTLLEWFIEDGAGDEYKFHIEEKDLNNKNYCDLQRLSELTSNLSPEVASPCVEKIYGPIHLALIKKNSTKGSLGKRVKSLELGWLTMFQATNNWHSAYKSAVRLNDMRTAANILNLWSLEGYLTEKPLFFARACLQLLSDGKVIESATLITNSTQYLEDFDKESENLSSAYAVWHMVNILTNLAKMEAKPRVDKQKIFGIITQRYDPLLASIDNKLSQLLEKVGARVYGIKPAGIGGPGAMSFLQNMLGNGPAQQPQATGKKQVKNGPGGMDMNAMMSMLSNIQNAK